MGGADVGGGHAGDALDDTLAIRAAPERQAMPEVPDFEHPTSVEGARPGAGASAAVLQWVHHM